MAKIHNPVLSVKDVRERHVRGKYCNKVIEIVSEAAGNMTRDDPVKCFCE